jgi:general secretion pathway protein G
MSPNPVLKRLSSQRLYSFLFGKGAGEPDFRIGVNFRANTPGCSHPSEDGFTLVELLAAITILLLLTSVVLPVVRVQVQRTREVELRQGLRQLRDAIDRYKDFSDRGMIPIKVDTFGYPPDLKTLLEGVALKGTATAKYKFLRRLPVDPMTGEADWGFRSMQDDADSRSWGGQNVFDVYSKSQGTALDGSRYGDW